LQYKGTGKETVYFREAPIHFLDKELKETKTAANVAPLMVDI
jgi:hypothetical protein